VAIFFEHDESPVMIVEVIAMVRSYWTSPALVSLGELSGGEITPQNVVVLGAGHPQAEVVEAICDADWLVATIEPVPDSASEGHVKALSRCVVAVDPDRAPLGVLQAELRLKVRDGDAEQTLTVPISGSHPGNIVLKPSRVVFGTVNRDVVTRTFQIDFVDVVDRERINVTSEHPFVEAVSTMKLGEKSLAVEVAVRRMEQAPAGLFEGHLTGRNDSGEPIFAVPYTGLFFGEGGPNETPGPQIEASKTDEDEGS
jgi:hypothetical protein